MQRDTEQTVMLIRTVPGMNCQGCVACVRRFKPRTRPPKWMASCRKAPGSDQLPDDQAG